MEIYAGFLEHTDHHVGLLVDALADLDILDDTLIYVIIGDNGASAEGSLQGTFNEMIDAHRLRRARDARVPHEQHRQVRRPGGVQPLRRGLGARDGHAVSVDEAGRVALGRHAQRHDRALAAAASKRRARSGRSSTTSSTSRRPILEAAHFPQPTIGQRRAAEADRRRQHGCTRSTTRRRPSVTRRSTSRCSAIAASITRAGPR